MRLSLTVFLIVCCCSGCLQVEDQLQLHADGSATVRLHTAVAEGADAEVLSELRWDMRETVAEMPVAWYPPLDAEEAEQLFAPGTVTMVFDDSGASTCEAHFSDLTGLLASAYAQLHHLAIRMDDGDLVVSGRNGARAFLACDELKPGSEILPGLVIEDVAATQRWRQRWSIALPDVEPAASWELRGGVQPAEALALRQQRGPRPAGFPQPPAQWAPAQAGWQQIAAGELAPLREAAQWPEGSASHITAQVLAAQWKDAYQYSSQSWGQREMSYLLMLSLPKELAAESVPAPEEITITCADGSTLQVEEVEPSWRAQGALQAIPEQQDVRLYRLETSLPGDPASAIEQLSGRLPIRTKDRLWRALALPAALPGPESAIHRSFPQDTVGGMQILSAQSEGPVWSVILQVPEGQTVAGALVYDQAGQPWPADLLIPESSPQTVTVLLWQPPPEDCHLVAIVADETAAEALRFTCGPVAFARPPARTPGDAVAEIAPELPALQITGLQSVFMLKVATDDIRLSAEGQRHLNEAFQRRLPGSRQHSLSVRLQGHTRYSLVGVAPESPPPRCFDQAGQELALTSWRFGEVDEDENSITCTLRIPYQAEGADSLAALTWAGDVLQAAAWEEYCLTEPQVDQRQQWSESAPVELVIRERTGDTQEGVEVVCELHGAIDLKQCRIELRWVGVSHLHSYIVEDQIPTEGSRRLTIRGRIWDEDERNSAGELQLVVRGPVDRTRHAAGFVLRDIDLR